MINKTINPNAKFIELIIFSHGNYIILCKLTSTLSFTRLNELDLPAMIQRTIKFPTVAMKIMTMKRLSQRILKCNPEKLFKQPIGSILCLRFLLYHKNFPCKQNSMIFLVFRVSWSYNVKNIALTTFLITSHNLFFMFC